MKHSYINMLKTIKNIVNSQLPILNCQLSILILLFIFGNKALSQEIPAEQNSNLAIKAIVINDSIKLRWAPANSKAWLDGKQYGYTIERFTAYKDNVFQETPEKKKLNETFLPKPLANWEKQAIASDYTAVIAQAFYGDEFMVYSPGSNDIASMINQSKEIDQRFATSVFMAEYDYQGALLAGWAYSDMDVKANEQYLYRIHINKPIPEPGDTAVILIGLSDKKELPKPVQVYFLFGDKSVMLSWNYFLQSDIYHSYSVERASGTDKTFRQITDLPVTPLNADDQELFFTDSLPDNQTIFNYRIRGITSFGNYGPYSDEVSGNGREIITCIPNIISGDFTETNKAEIYWKLECEKIDLIEKLEIKQSTTIEGEYQTIADHIPANQQSAFLDLKDPVNYLKIYAYPKDGKPTESFPYRLQQVDSIPPAIPAGLKAEIDTLGIAHLSWTPNIEPDLRGYRILRSFQENEEKSSITPQLITTTGFSDTLSLNNLNRYVYYSISAIDTYYNESKTCPHIRVEKPDLSPPSEPVITSFIQNDNKVSLTWVVSNKDTTIRYSVSRICENDLNPKIIFEGNNKNRSYTDELTESGKYKYKVIATSKYGKNIYSSQQPVAEVYITEELEPVQGLTYYQSDKDNYIELSWRKHPQAISYILYKKEEDNPMELFRELDASVNKYVDEAIHPSVAYTYMIVYSTNNGMKSKPKFITIKN